MKPKVSVVIPVFNGENFVASAITSLQEQTFENLEIIIIDDSSTDATYEIAKTFESKNCVIVRQDNQGAAVARNKGLEYATGEYVQFLDIDDFLSKDKIEKQVKALRGHRNKIAVCNYIEFFEEKELNSPLELVDQSHFIYSSDSPVNFLINLYGGNGKSNFIQTNSWLTPRDLIDKVGGWRAYRCPDDDGEFFARVLLASNGIVHVPGVFNFYRRSSSTENLSNRVDKKYVQNALLTIDLKYRYLFQFTNHSSLTKAMAMQYLRFAVATFPRHKVLSAIAYNKYKALNTFVLPPKLGGKLVEAVKNLLGWKTARFIRYYLREKLL